MRRLGVGGLLATTLTKTNCIESTISVARITMDNVKNWQGGSMKKRWVAAGMLEAERSKKANQDRDHPRLKALRRPGGGPPPPPDRRLTPTTRGRPDPRFGCRHELTCDRSVGRSRATTPAAET